jgi:Ca-activated chloride channel family protein
MSFIWPTMLLLLLAVPLLVLLYMRMQRRRQRLAAAYGSMGLMQQAAGRELGWRRHIPPALFLCGPGGHNVTGQALSVCGHAEKL